MAEALKSAAKAASAQLTELCVSDVCGSQPDAATDVCAQLLQLQKLGGDAPVDALNIDAPAFCPITTMAPPAAATALKDAADEDGVPLLRVAAAEFVPTAEAGAAEAAALPAALRGVCPLPMPPPVGTEVLRAQLLRLCKENERAKARHAELQAELQASKAQAGAVQAQAARRAAEAEVEHVRRECAALRQEIGPLRERCTQQQVCSLAPHIPSVYDEHSMAQHGRRTAAPAAPAWAQGASHNIDTHVSRLSRAPPQAADGPVRTHTRTRACVT